MANLNTKIEWCDATWSPVTGCSKVSTGCQKCYAERLFPRVYGKDTVRDVGMSGLRGEIVERKRKFTDVKLHPERLKLPLHWKKPRMVFVNSMSDLFHEDIPFEFINKIWTVMLVCHWHTFQILTKRPERMAEFFREKKHSWTGSDPYDMPKNIWLGISCENQATADERIPILLQVPAAVKWVSFEPLLGAIKFPPGDPTWELGLDWAVIGGESDPTRPRKMEETWALNLVAQLRACKVPVFFKQNGGSKKIDGHWGGNRLAGEIIQEFPPPSRCL